MPIYEYWCARCARKVEILTLRIRDAGDPVCPRCGGSGLRRLLSRFASPKSEEARLEALTDPSNFSGLDENDPAGMARWLKRMGREMGEDISAEEIDQVADEIASGGAGPDTPPAADAGGSSPAGGSADDVP